MDTVYKKLCVQTSYLGKEYTIIWWAAWNYHFDYRETRKVMQSLQIQRNKI